MIYFDSAATTFQKPPSVAAAMQTALATMSSPGRGGYGVAMRAAELAFDCRSELAELFGMENPEQVVFTMNATHALNIAISGLLGPGDHVISTDWEHNSVLRPLYRLEENGGAVSFLPADEQGRLDYDRLPELLRRETKAVVCTHASNLTGDVVDLKRMADFAKKH